MVKQSFHERGQRGEHSLMHPALQFLDHRPWPLPNEPWRWRQAWHEVGFVHYRVPVSHIRNLVPPSLEIEQWDDSAWLSIVPFRMHDVMKRNLPSCYPFRSFLELNVRTYVKFGDRPGVWFFSLDANCLPLVIFAKILYGLPYFRAKLSIQNSNAGNGYDFRSQRSSCKTPFHATCRPKGPPTFADPGTFAHWVTERYCLYSRARNGRMLRIDVHHKQWPLRDIEIDIHCNDLFKSLNIEVHDSNPRCHFSDGVEVISFSPQVMTPA